MLEKLKYKNEERPKTAFFAGDFFKPALDLYFAFTGEPKTNPFTWQGSLKLGAGCGVEDQMMKILKHSGLVEEDYNQRTHGRVEFLFNGKVPVHGYIDAKLVNGEPLEIKSINNANTQDIWKYDHEMPRENYVGQLGTYMHFLKKRTGHLFVCSIDGLHPYWFTANLQGGIVTCGKTRVNLLAEYSRWEKIWDENILPKKMPDLWQYRYKYPIEEIDWHAIPKATITAARSNKKVIGDYQVSWSPWKNRIIELQGETLGYTVEEINRIKELTAGYSTWKKASGQDD